MRRRGFTLIELMLASTLSVLLIAGVLFAVASLSRDACAAAAAAQSGAPDLQGTLNLLQWDLTNARSITQSGDRRVILIGHGAIAPDTLQPNNRLVQIVYTSRLRGNAWQLIRTQQYLDDPARPQRFNELVAQGISSLEVLPSAGEPMLPDTRPGDDSGNLAMRLPQWVRVRIYGPSVAMEKLICIK